MPRQHNPKNNLWQEPEFKAQSQFSKIKDYPKTPDNPQKIATSHSEASTGKKAVAMNNLLNSGKPRD